MKLMKVGLTILCATAITLVGASVKPEPPRIDRKELMKSKLAASQKILEGIATENFTTIAEQARKLELFSRAAAWSAHSTPEYRRFTEDFRRHASALAKNAQNRNLDAATVSWFQLTVSCVNCHKYMRGDEVASSSVYLSDNL